MTNAAAMKLSVPKVSERAVAYCVPPLALRNSRCASNAHICSITPCACFEGRRNTAKDKTEEQKLKKRMRRTRRKRGRGGKAGFCKQ